MDYAAEHERIKSERKTETRIVKNAVIGNGYQNVSVGHGTGTACGWLHIRADQKPGQTWQNAYHDLVRIAQGVTDRKGKHGGRINANIREP